MTRRAGQRGWVYKDENESYWWVRFRVDREGGRSRVSKKLGPARGPHKLNEKQARNRALEVIQAAGVNRPEHLERAQHPERFVQRTFLEQVEWLRANKPRWTESKPGSVSSVDSILRKHVLPHFGDMQMDEVSESAVQQFAATLRRTVFAGPARKGVPGRPYRLSYKTVKNIVDVVKRVVGKPAQTWELDLGRASKPVQRYFTNEEVRRMIEAAEDPLRTLLALLAGAGLRVGEALGLYIEDVDLGRQVITIRRTIWNGVEQAPKTDAGVREVPIDETLAEMVRQFIGDRKTGYVFVSARGTPLDQGNLRRRGLGPLLKRLGIKTGGFHALRHHRVTALRRGSIPEELIRRWIGHSALSGTLTDRYSHTHEEVDYVKELVARVGLDRVVGPIGPKAVAVPGDPLKTAV